MTDEELAAIKARAEAASPGPWNADFTDDGFNVRPDNGCTLRGGERDDVIVARVTEADSKDDILFIAHAREDIAALLSEVEAWREIGRAVAEGGDYGHECEWCDAYAPDMHESDCPVTKARALLGIGEGEVSKHG